MAWRTASGRFSSRRRARRSFAALFIFYPSHDSTVFWFTTQYLMLTAAFYLYAYYLASHNRLGGPAAMATLGSFVSYGSTPWAFGLGLAFLLQRQYRRAAALVVPNLIYIGYYAAVTVWLERGNRRLPGQLDAEQLLKQLVLQIAGGADAVLGPSLWLKTWYSVASLTLASAIVGAAILVLLIRHAPPEDLQARLPPALWLGMAAVAFSAFGMFALTGAYPQSAFAMVNRVTLYASFAAAFLIVYFARRAWSAGALAALLVFSSLGISDHWRAWARIQDGTIEAIRTHPELTAGRLGSDTLFVVGHDYSRLGPIAPSRSSPTPVSPNPCSASP